MERRKGRDIVPRDWATPKRYFEDLDRVFDDFRSGLEDMFWTPGFTRMVPWSRTGVRQALVDVKDTGKEIVVTAEMPGVKKEDLDIDVSANGVEIRAKVEERREETDEGYVYQERSHTSWYRRLPFPAEILPDKSEAELRDGILALRFPKKEPEPEKKSRKVQVK